MSYDSASLTTPDIKWLGVRPSDLDRYNIPEQCRLDMTEHDIKTGKELLQVCVSVCPWLVHLHMLVYVFARVYVYDLDKSLLKWFMVHSNASLLLHTEKFYRVVGVRLCVLGIQVKIYFNQFTEAGPRFLQLSVFCVYP